MELWQFAMLVSTWLAIIFVFYYNIALWSSLRIRDDFIYDVVDAIAKDNEMVDGRHLYRMLHRVYGSPQIERN